MRVLRVAVLAALIVCLLSVNVLAAVVGRSPDSSFITAERTPDQCGRLAGQSTLQLRHEAGS